MTGLDGPVLVTEGTGFLGGWCIAQLLEGGYEVRTTRPVESSIEDTARSLLEAPLDR